MRIVYIADDGKEFDDEFDCIDYEWKLNHPSLNDVHLYDKDSNELDDMFSENTYGAVMKIIIPSESAVRDLQKLGDYTGYCCYEWIDEPGEWIWDDEGSKFVKSKII